MPIRAKDIAEMLNVSTATVSIVLNNKPGVSSETRSLIINKIKEMNCDYLLKNIPATAAETGTIGFVVYKRFGDIIDEAPFFSYALELSLIHIFQKYPLVLLGKLFHIPQPQIPQHTCDMPFF